MIPSFISIYDFLLASSLYNYPVFIWILFGILKLEVVLCFGIGAPLEVDCALAVEASFSPSLISKVSK